MSTTTLATSAPAFPTAAPPAHALKTRPRPPALREFRYTRDDYRTLTDIGLFDGTRVELIRGRLIEMPAMSDEHGTSVMKSGRVLRRIFPENSHTVRPALPFVAADDSEPEPDFCVVLGDVESVTTHPGTCLLLVEISLATLAFDRDVKAPLYAESGVQEYWIVNLVDRVVEVRRQPARGTDGTWAYAQTRLVRPGERSDLLSAPGATVDPAELLP